MPSRLYLVPYLAAYPGERSELEIFLRQSEPSPNGGGGPLSRCSLHPCSFHWIHKTDCSTVEKAAWRQSSAHAVRGPQSQLQCGVHPDRRYAGVHNSPGLTPGPWDLKATPGVGIILMVHPIGIILMVHPISLTLLEEDARFET